MRWKGYKGGMAMKRFLARYWIYTMAAAIGISLTPIAVRLAAAERGYSGAFGGEYLLVPLFLLIIALIDGLINMSKNAPAEIYICKYCGEPIVEGEEYMEYDGDYYHLEDCARDAAVSILLSKAGATSGTAEVEDRW